MRDLSVRCGLSISAVSKALSNHPDISKKTKARVLQAAAEMGYAPNPIARALKTNRSYNIGVLLDDADHHGLLHHFFVPVLESFRSCVENQGYDLTMMNHNVGNRKMSYLNHYRHRLLDGVFIACMDFEDPQLVEMAAAGIPLVTIDHLYDGNSVVYSDNLGGIMTAVRHAADAGHTRIAYITGSPSGVTATRIAGYRQVMQERGLPTPAEYMPRARYRDIPLTQQKTQELLMLPNPPTCILMPDDYAALGGLTAIRKAGLKVPRDVSVIGYDGMDILKYLEPRLATVKQDTDSLGRHAAKLLVGQIEKRVLPAGSHSVTVPAAFVPGQSVAPPRGAPTTNPYSVLSHAAQAAK